MGENVEVGSAELPGTVTMETVVGDDVSVGVEGVVGVMVVSGGVVLVLTTMNGVAEGGGDGVFVTIGVVVVVADGVVLVVVTADDVLVVGAADDMLVIPVVAQDHGAV